MPINPPPQPSAVQPPTEPEAPEAPATPVAPPTVNSSELYTVDKKTDTVAGQLENYTNMQTPLMKRIAEQGRAQAKSRGLGNSTIAGQGAIGKVLDKSGEWATTDAGHYNNRKTESLRAATSKYGTDESVKSAAYTADKGLEGQKYSSDQQLKGQKYTADKGLQGDLARASAAVSSASISASGQMGAAAIAAKSRENVAAKELESSNNRLRADVAMRTLDRASNEDMNRARIDGSKAAATRAHTRDGVTRRESAATDTYNTFQNGVANIDQTASKGTQQEQYSRLILSRDTTLDAIGAMRGGTAIARSQPVGDETTLAATTPTKALKWDPNGGNNDNNQRYWRSVGR